MNSELYLSHYRGGCLEDKLTFPCSDLLVSHRDTLMKTAFSSSDHISADICGPNPTFPTLFSTCILFSINPYFVSSKQQRMT